MYGDVSTKALTNLIAGKNITIHTVASVQKDNLTGVVQYKQYISCPPPKFPDGARAFECYNMVDVNLEMLRQGWARYIGTIDQNPQYRQIRNQLSPAPAAK